MRCVEAADPLWKTLLSPGLILFSARIAYVCIRNVRSVARQRATLDIIEKFESTEHCRDLNTAFSSIRKARRFEDLHDPKDDEAKRLRGQVQDYLNHYELVAIGIRHDILDLSIYRKWMASAVVRDWNAACSYVQQERWRVSKDGKSMVYHDQLYGNYQWMALKIARHEAKHIDRWSSREPDLPATVGPGDDPLPEVDTTK